MANFSNCGCNLQGIYGTNMWNVNTTNTGSCGQPAACNGCIDITKTDCVVYAGSNLTNTGINKNDTLAVILTKLDAIKAIQDAKNTKILAALNDLNARVNALAATTNPAYTLI